MNTAPQWTSLMMLLLLRSALKLMLLPIATMDVNGDKELLHQQLQLPQLSTQHQQELAFGNSKLQLPLELLTHVK
jgi:hypothetical protein